MTTERIAEHVQFAYRVPNVSGGLAQLWKGLNPPYNKLATRPATSAECPQPGRRLILGGFLHFQEEIEYFGSRVLPLVREIERAEEKWADAPVLVSA